MLENSESSSVRCCCCDRMTEQNNLPSPSLGLTCSTRGVTCRTTLDYSEHRSKLKTLPHGKLPSKCLNSSSQRSNTSNISSTSFPTIQRLSCLVYLVTLLLLAQSIGLAESATWVKRPQSVEKVLDQEVILECEVQRSPQEQNFAIQWRRFIGTQKELLFTDSIKNPATPARMSLVSGTNNLKISAVTIEDSTEFECNPFGSALSAVSATVTVLVQPGAPVISLDSTVLTEGRNVMLTCSSFGGSPTPSIVWKRDGAVVTATVTAPTVAGRETKSELMRNLVWTDHDAEYTCEVKNKVIADPLVTTQKLDVRYAPRITFEHDANEPGKYIAVKDQATTLICNTNANPPVNAGSFRWMKDEQNRGERNDRLTFPSVAKADIGSYTCFANNQVGAEQNASIFLDVHYPPVITNVPAQKIVNESDFVNVTAVVDANIEPFSHIWQKGGDINPKTDRYSLVINSVTRGDAQNYTFKVVNRLRPTGQDPTSGSAEATMELIVQYSPGVPTISPLSSHSVGDRVDITCNLPVPGIPAPTYEWQKVGQTTISLGKVFTIATATLPDSGQYQCRGRNTLGAGPWQTIRLTINEDARFTTNLPPTRNVTINQEGFSLSCEARGNPRPYIQWKKNGSPFPNSGDGDFYAITQEESDTADGYSYLLKSNLEFKGFKRTNDPTGSGREDQLVMDDTANYTCEIGLGRSQTTYLMVLYPPVVTVHPLKVAQVLNSTVQFRCSARATPEPSFRWLFGEQELNSADKYRIQSGIQGTTQGEYLSTLTIYNLAEEDMGDYRCRSHNELGFNKPDVGLASVVRKSAPDAPTDLAIADTTWNSVLLQWEPGFNGGEEQNFIISYTSEKSVGSEKVPKLLYMRNITGLHPNTLYKFNVVGNNSFGSGAVSETINISTNYYNFTIPTDVKFNRFTNTLLFHAPTGAYTARIEVKLADRDDWIVSEESASTSGGSIKLKEKNVEDVRISFCLESQTNICSEPVKAEHTGVEPEKNDMPIEWVIAIACVCGIVIILLIIALVYVLRRRKQTKANKDYELETQANRRSQPINGTRPANGDVRNNSPKRGYDNPDYSSPQLNGGPGYKAPNHHPPRPNGHIPRNDSFGSQDSMQKYPDENDINGRHIQSYGDRPLEFIYLPHHFNNYQDLPPPYRGSRPAKDPYMDYQHKDSSMSGQESGYSTPEPAKPKKVIYEVIV